MRIEIRVNNDKGELLTIVTDITSEQIPSFLQAFHRKLDEFNKKQPPITKP